MRPYGSELREILIIGTGRVGLAFAEQLVFQLPALPVTIVGRAREAPDHPLFGSGRVRYDLLDRLDALPSTILIAVPDDQISDVGKSLAHLQLPRVPVLHTSGVLDRRALAAAASAGYPTGSLHPLVALAGTTGSSERLIGAWYAIEGEARATQAARWIVETLKGKPLQVEPNGKPLYHAAAVFASNYVVVLLAIAIDLMRAAGVERSIASAAVAELAAGAIGNLRDSDPVSALTGPISRGDSATVATHLGVLSSQWRSLYSGLAREALEMARSQGLDPAAAARITRVLAEAP